MKNNNIHTKLLMYTGSAFLIVMSLVAIASVVIMGERGDVIYENTISVSGTADITSEPDVAVFSFSVEETAKESKDAQDTVSQKMNDILDSLEDLDIEDKDIETDSYSIYPKSEYVTLKNPQEDISVDGEVYIANNRGRYVQVGYTVRQSVTVKLRDFDMIPEALELFTQYDVENLNGPNFQIDDPEALQDQARKEAIADAKEKAKKLAKDLGVKLGDIVSFNEGNTYYYDEPYYAASSMMDMKSVSEERYTPNLPTGEEEVSSYVTIIFEIK